MQTLSVQSFDASDITICNKFIEINFLQDVTNAYLTYFMLMYVYICLYTHSVKHLFMRIFLPAQTGQTPFMRGVYVANIRVGPTNTHRKHCIQLSLEEIFSFSMRTA